MWLSVNIPILKSLRFGFVLTVVLLNQVVIYGQTNTIDSLRNELRHSDNKGPIACDMCIEFGYELMRDSLEKCLERAYTMELSLNDSLKLIVPQIKMTSNLGDTTAVDSLFNSMIDRAKSLDDPAPLSNLYQVYLISQEWLGMCEKAFPVAREFWVHAREIQHKGQIVESGLALWKNKKCLDPKANDSELLDSILQQIGDDPYYIGHYHFRLGQAYYFNDQSPEAIAELLDAYHFYRKANAPAEIAKTFSLTSDAYYDIQDDNQALKYLRLAMPHYRKTVGYDLALHLNSLGWSFYNVGMYDSALVNYKKSLSIFNNVIPSSIDIAYPMGNLALVYREFGILDSAEHFSKEAIKLFEKQNYTIGIAEAYNNLASIEYLKGNTRAAKDHFRMVLEIIPEEADEREHITAHKGLSEILEKTDPAAALYHLKEYLRLEEELLEGNEVVLAQGIEASFLIEQKQKTIDELELVSKFQELEIEKKSFLQKVYLVGMLVSFIFLIYVLYYWVARRKLLSKLQDLVTTQKRIIQMISHDFRGPINNIRMLFELMKQEELDDDEFEILSGDLYRQSAEVSLMFDSFVVWAMSQTNEYTPNNDEFVWSDMFDDVLRLMHTHAKMRQIDLKITRSEDEEVYTDRMAISLILRNLISNAIKYSAPNSVIELGFYPEGNMMISYVKDYGSGMSKVWLAKVMASQNLLHESRLRKGTGLGLKMVINFVEALGGTISAESEVNKGTEFKIAVPIDERSSN